MKQKKILSVLCSILLLPNFVLASTTNTTDVQPPTVTFSDVPNTHPNFLAIQNLASQGVLKGYADGTFKPDQLVNRAEATKVILQGASVEVSPTVSNSSFTDIKITDWFATYVMKAKEIAIVQGNPDGSFAPARNVSRAEFIKMLLSANGFKSDNWAGKQIFNDVPADAWFAPYLNFAGQVGLLAKDSQNNLYPSRQLTRGEVAQIIYLTNVVLHSSDTQFLLNQAEKQISQIEIYIASNQPSLAKLAAELSVDMTQQALHNLPSNNIVLGAAKVARGYDYLVNSYISALSKKDEDAKSWANQAITKATEAWEANNDLQPIARHIKDLANGLLGQLPA